MILQLDPPIPMITPKGHGIAFLLLDYGAEFNLIWVVGQDGDAELGVERGEIWAWQNPLVRLDKNITMGRV